MLESRLRWGLSHILFLNYGYVFLTDSGEQAGSFAKTLASLILTQGIMYGVGFLIFYYPILSMVDEFWVTRRGMAYGLLCSASGASGSIMPLVIQALLRKY